MHGSDAPGFAAYLLAHQSRRPPDHLLVRNSERDILRVDLKLTMPTCIGFICSYRLSGLRVKRPKGVPFFSIFCLQGALYFFFSSNSVFACIARCECSALLRGDRVHTAFKYNILDHFGKVSTLRGTVSPRYPRCFTEVKQPVVFEVGGCNTVLRAPELLIVIAPHCYELLCVPCTPCFDRSRCSISKRAIPLKRIYHHALPLGRANRCTAFQIGLTGRS
jgi:hypothetical protein